MLNESVRTEVVRCRVWGVPAVLVLLLPGEARSLLGAVWLWSDGATMRDATIGRA